MLGENEDGGLSCPLCVEEMDTTDLSFLPCPCGYQVRLQGTSLIRNSALLGPYSRTMHRALWWVDG